MTRRPPASVTVRAPAKINLFLGVGAPREDGFHPLATVFHAVSLYDDVTVRASDEWSLSLQPAPYVDPDAVPLDESNIVWKAARLLADHHGREPVADVTITKGIPVAGGMAGGSADAAATLVALDRLWRLRTPDAVMLELAAELGSDVPFALLGGNKLGTGRGEILEDISAKPFEVHEMSYWWVVVPSDEGLSTPAVYKRYDELFPDAPAEPTSARRIVKGSLPLRNPDWLQESLHNDLQPAAIDLRPDLAAVLDDGKQAGALGGLVSGSGPTCVFLARSADHAREVASGLLERGHDVVLVANGPVAGAHVVKYA